MIPRALLVLLVDDQEDGRDLLREALEHHGFAVAEAENGKAALDRMRSGLRPDIVILDLNMPVMSGIELLEEMKADATLADVPVLIFTGNLGIHVPLDAPVVRQLWKPCTLGRLLASVEACLNRAKPAMT